MARTSAQDPLEKFRFLVIWDNGQTRAGFHDCQLPKRTTTSIGYREGTFADASQYSAGLNTFEDVVLSRGVISAAVEAKGDMYNWITQIHNPATNPGTVSAGPTGGDVYRKDITIVMLDRDANYARAWKLYQCFPSHFVPGSDLSAAEDGDKSMESLTLKYEDFAELAINGTDLNTVLT